MATLPKLTCASRRPVTKHRQAHIRGFRWLVPPSSTWTHSFILTSPHLTSQAGTSVSFTLSPTFQLKPRSSFSQTATSKRFGANPCAIFTFSVRVQDPNVELIVDSPDSVKFIRVLARTACPPHCHIFSTASGTPRDSLIVTVPALSPAPWSTRRSSPSTLPSSILIFLPWADSSNSKISRPHGGRRHQRLLSKLPRELSILSSSETDSC